MPGLYKRVLLKLSGEALAGGKGSGIDNSVVNGIAGSIRECVQSGVELAVVVGGGNYWRGRTSEHMDRVKADHIGMLATVMNALTLAEAFRVNGIAAHVHSAVDLSPIAMLYDRDKALLQLQEGAVVIFGCGTGSPFFSTDSAAALRASEIGADILFKATTVDGIYDKDPKVHPDAKWHETITYTEILKENLKVIDSTAASMLRDNGIPSFFFNLNDPQNIVRAMKREIKGSFVKED